MVTAQHEALHRIFREDAELFARAMQRVFDVEVPVPDGVTILNADLTETQPLERRADSVILVQFMIENPNGRYILVVESQTDPDRKKKWSWPYYIAYLRDKYECPVVLLVVCSKAATAEWARARITSGLPGLICMWVEPVVLGPGNVPAITDLAEAQDDIWFAVLSALTHSRSQRVREILEVLAEALTTIDNQSAEFFAEFTEQGLAGTSSRDIWRNMMRGLRYPYPSQMRIEAREEGLAEGREEGLAEGREEGLAVGAVRTRVEDILRILARRGLEVPAETRQVIEACTDMGKLEIWFDRSLVIDDIADLFA
jgi:hypothetical protein